MTTAFRPALPQPTFGILFRQRHRVRSDDSQIGKTQADREGLAIVQGLGKMLARIRKSTGVVGSIWATRFRMTADSATTDETTAMSPAKTSSFIGRKSAAPLRSP